MAAQGVEPMTVEREFETASEPELKQLTWAVLAALVAAAREG